MFYEDAFVACDAYQHELADIHRLNGCVGWTPKTDEVVEASNGAAKVLVSNRNLLVVADVLAVNKGFAKANPKMVEGLVHGILEGNRRLRDDQGANIAVVAKAFKWSEEERATSSRTCICPTCRRAARFSRAPSTRPDRSVASSSLRCLRTAASSSLSTQFSRHVKFGIWVIGVPTWIVISRCDFNSMLLHVSEGASVTVPLSVT